MPRQHKRHHKGRGWTQEFMLMLIQLQARSPLDIPRRPPMTHPFTIFQAFPWLTTTIPKLARAIDVLELEVFQVYGDRLEVSEGGRK